MANVVYLIRKTSVITSRNLLEQDLTHSSNTLQGQFLQILAAAKESLRISMIPGIVVLFYRSLLNMVPRKKYKIKTTLIHTLIYRSVNQRVKKIFLKVLKKMFLSFERWSVKLGFHYRFTWDNLR